MDYKYPLRRRSPRGSERASISRGSVGPTRNQQRVEVPPGDRIGWTGSHRRRAGDCPDRVKWQPSTVRASCTIRRTRRRTSSCHRRKGHDDPRHWCRSLGWIARAASPAATPPCGYGSSWNRQLLGAV